MKFFSAVTIAVLATFASASPAPAADVCASVQPAKAAPLSAAAVATTAWISTLS
ncbi:hypothetical protein PENSTE_c002G00453 [Penicillium steckii]|uniref:Uncharacterized protein n=1 Tax=Penicillium steckii TaxID=303698 RepID=A0A1V6TTP6_9EURO|nr:hypothetical protein PENSTE_c002G00453 [Penicillium steckii]